MKRFLIYFLLLLSGFTHAPVVTSAQVIEYHGTHVTEGAGIKISIPRVTGAREWMKPLMKWFEPGEGHSPYIADLFPCDELSCRGRYAISLNVYISRAREPNPTEPSEPGARLRHRANTILKANEASRSKQGQILDKREPRAMLETMTIAALGDSFWARVERRFKDGSSAGVLYLRAIDDDLTGYASFALQSAPLPKGITVQALDEAFEGFVRRIRIEVIPKPVTEK